MCFISRRRIIIRIDGRGAGKRKIREDRRVIRRRVGRDLTRFGRVCKIRCKEADLCRIRANA